MSLLCVYRATAPHNITCPFTNKTADIFPEPVVEVKQRLCSPTIKLEQSILSSKYTCLCKKKSAPGF